MKRYYVKSAMTRELEDGLRNWPTDIYDFICATKEYCEVPNISDDDSSQTLNDIKYIDIEYSLNDPGTLIVKVTGDIVVPESNHWPSFVRKGTMLFMYKDFGISLMMTNDGIDLSIRINYIHPNTDSKRTIELLLKETPNDI